MSTSKLVPYAKKEDVKVPSGFAVMEAKDVKVVGYDFSGSTFMIQAHDGSVYANVSGPHIKCLFPAIAVTNDVDNPIMLAHIVKNAAHEITEQNIVPVTEHAWNQLKRTHYRDEYAQYLQGLPKPNPSPNPNHDPKADQ